MTSPSKDEKHNHIANTTTTTNPNTSLSPSVDLNNLSQTFDNVAPHLPTLITTLVEPSTESKTDSYISATGEASDIISRKKGRGKVEMKKMEKESNLLVTFSKRRSGLFKKANEICTLCGVECAVVVFSPAGKVFSFGHPSVNTVVDKYLSRNLMAQKQVERDHFKNQGNDDIKNLTTELTDLTDAFELAKKYSQSLDKRREERQAMNWFERPLQHMNNIVQLDIFKQAMVDLKSKVYEQVGMLMKTSITSSSISPNITFKWSQQCDTNIDEAKGLGSDNDLRSFGGLSSWCNKEYDINEAGSSGVDKNGEGQVL